MTPPQGSRDIKDSGCQEFIRSPGCNCYSNPRLSILREMLKFSWALSIKSCAIDKFAIRARRTGRQAVKTPIICARGVSGSAVSGLPSEVGSVAGGSVAIAEIGRDVNLRIEDSRLEASSCKFSA